MIFLFCSVYSTCRCPFFFAKLLPGRMVKYRHANRQRTERQLSANQRFGYFKKTSCDFLAGDPPETRRHCTLILITGNKSPLM